jgi:hypothetical protein
MPICFSVFPILSYRSFTFSDLILRSLMQFELMVGQERLGCSFYLLQEDIHLSQNHLLKRLSFLQVCFGRRADIYPYLFSYIFKSQEKF